jgi:DNA-binding MurR/RpiR family transcriptional regulator
MIRARSAQGDDGRQSKVLQAISQHRSSLTPGEDRAATYLISHYPAAGLGPMARFARAAGISPQTVMRLLAKLGLANWEQLQERLRMELATEESSPLGRWTAYRPRPFGSADWLQDLGARLARNVTDTFAALAPRDFEAMAALLADRKRPVVVAGGRFTQQIAVVLARHLQIVRGGVQDLGTLSATWADRLIDVDKRTTAVAFDVRRYSRETIRFAAAAAKQGATVIAVTDDAKAPITGYATYSIVGSFQSVGTWDSITAHLAITEALVARVTELSGDRTADRLTRIDAIRTVFEDDA